MNVLRKQTTNDLPSSNNHQKRPLRCRGMRVFPLRQNNHAVESNTTYHHKNDTNPPQEQHQHQATCTANIQTSMEVAISALTSAAIRDMNVHEYEMTTLCLPYDSDNNKEDGSPKSEQRYMQLVIRARVVNKDGPTSHHGEDEPDLCDDDDVSIRSSSSRSQPPSVIHVTPSKRRVLHTPQLPRRNAVCLPFDEGGNSVTTAATRRDAKTKSSRHKSKRSRSQQAHSRRHKDRRPHKSGIQQYRSCNANSDVEPKHYDNDGGSSSLTPFETIRPLAPSGRKPKGSVDSPKTTKKKKESSSSSPKTTRRPRTPTTKSPLREEMKRKQREKMLQQKAILSCPNLLKEG